MSIKFFVIPYLLCCISFAGFCQQSIDSTTSTSFSPLKNLNAAKSKISGLENGLSNTIEAKYVAVADKKATQLSAAIEKKSLKTLERLQKQEQKLQQKLALKDSVAAKTLFAQNKYKQFAAKIKNPPAASKLKEYIPQFDSLKTSLKFLSPPTPQSGIKAPAYLSAASAHVSELEGKMQAANELKAYIKERKALLKTQLEKVGMLQDMKALNKEAYYYSAQLNEYKSVLKDPKKIEQKALAQLAKLPAFNEFMKKNSQLALLFKMPDNYGTAESLAGLQTRASVQNMIQAKFGLTPASGGAGGMQYINQQMQQAQGELKKLKDKWNQAGGGSGDVDMPDFKPNNQKIKSFLKRIEYGVNVQSQRPNNLLPVTTDFALTAGYKLNDKSIVGLGASYKLGWGNGLKDIHFSTQGLGLRSYVDMKLKGSFWISGGYEKNYESDLTPSLLQGGGVRIKPWQTSGLIGLTKKYKIGKKTNSLQLLWDFLSYEQVPRAQPIVFRVGYVF